MQRQICGGWSAVIPIGKCSSAGLGGLRSCDSRDGFGAKLNNGTKCYKNTVIYGKITVFGTPGETRTHYLALRRRALYPGELRGHSNNSIVPKNSRYVNKRIFDCKNDIYDV